MTRRGMLIRIETTRVSLRAAVLAMLDGFDAEAYLRSAGLTAGDLARVRCRLLV